MTTRHLVLLSSSRSVDQPRACSSKSSAYSPFSSSSSSCVAVLFHRPVLHHDDLIGHVHGREAMRDEDRDRAVVPRRDGCAASR